MVAERGLIKPKHFITLTVQGRDAMEHAGEEQRGQLFFPEQGVSPWKVGHSIFSFSSTPGASSRNARSVMWLVVLMADP